MTETELWQKCKAEEWDHWPTVERLINLLQRNGKGEWAEVARKNFTDKHGPPAERLPVG